MNHNDCNFNTYVKFIAEGCHAYIYIYWELSIDMHSFDKPSQVHPTKL